MSVKRVCGGKLCSLEEEEELDVGDAVSLGGTQRTEVATLGKNTLE